MTDKIKLVQGDRRPRITINLTNELTGTAIDVSDPTTTVALEFRKKGATAFTSLPCVKSGGGSGGVVYMDWPAGALDGTPGDYEAQIVVDLNGERQTVYETLKFYMRDNFTP